MELLGIFSFALFAILNVVLGMKRINGLSTLLQLMFFVLTVVTLTTGMNETSIVWYMVILVAANIALSRFKILRGPTISLIPLIVSVAGFLLLNSGTVVEHFSDKYGLINKFTIAGSSIAAIVPLFVSIKKRAIAQVFNVRSEELERAVSVCLIALSIFLSHFGAGYLGVLLSSGILISAFAYVDLEFDNHAASPLILIMTGHFISAYSLELDLLQADIIFGLILGAFFVLMLSGVLERSNDKLLLPLVSLVIIVGMSIGVVFLGNEHPLMGGVDALVALLVAVALFNFTLSGVYPAIVVSSVVVTLLLANPVDQTIDDSIQTNENTQLVESPEETKIKLLPIDDLSGKYTINKEGSSVSFIMGKKGETKGAFKQIEGLFILDEDLSKNEIRIELSLDHFTTFNRMRDESLMTDEYFDQKNYPVMNFSAKGWTKAEENEYQVVGQFSMLGKTLEETVILKRIKSDNAIMFIGEGKIDRTKYGMTPSATEGNIVSFTYEVVLQGQK